VNGNPYTVPAIVLCAAMLITTIAGLYWVSTRRDRQPPYRPGHTHRAVRARLRAESGAPRDVTGPEGRRFIEELHQDLGKPPPDWRDEKPGGIVQFTGTVDAATLARVRDVLAGLPPPPDWWDEDAPAGRIEILTGPGAAIRQTSEVTLGVLARVRDRLAGLGREPEPDDTAHDLHAVATWGKTAPELADELAARYLI